jgi:hypothetical protein
MHHLPSSSTPQDRGRLFQLLSDHPPRDLAAPEVDLLRSLPLYARLPPPAAAFNADGPSTSAEGGEAASGGGSGAVAEREELVALGDRTDWLLVPARCLDQLGGGAPFLGAVRSRAARQLGLAAARLFDCVENGKGTRRAGSAQRDWG